MADDLSLFASGAGEQAQAGLRNTIALTSSPVWTSTDSQDAERRETFFIALRTQMARDSASSISVLIADPLCASKPRFIW